MDNRKHLENYFELVSNTSKDINQDKINKLIDYLVEIRNNNGRLFFLGVGGSAANASHAINDFRKLCNIQCYSPFDNISELTARINDEGWESALKEWLKVSRITSNDAIFILSVGGGNLKKNVSVNLINAIKYAKENSAKILGIVGRDGGYTKANGDCVILVPTLDEKLVTPISESFQAVIWHSIVSSPSLQVNNTKW
jgi:D-sedoheptulose 7-phosphate isomerase